MLWIFVYVGHTSVMEHDHTLKSCEVPACNENPTSQSLGRVLRWSVAVNGLNAIIGLCVALATRNTAVIGDVVHTSSDIGAHIGHVKTLGAENDNLLQKTDGSRRKVKYIRTATAGLILAGATYSGSQAVDSFQNRDSNKSVDYLALVTELGAAASYGGLFLATNRRNDGSMAFKDSRRHNLTDFGISVIAAGSIALNAEYVGATYATIMSGVIAVKNFTGHVD